MSCHPFRISFYYYSSSGRPLCTGCLPHTPTLKLIRNSGRHACMSSSNQYPPASCLVQVCLVSQNVPCSILFTNIKHVHYTDIIYYFHIVALPEQLPEPLRTVQDQAVLDVVVQSPFPMMYPSSTRQPCLHHRPVTKPLLPLSFSSHFTRYSLTSAQSWTKWARVELHDLGMQGRGFGEFRMGLGGVFAS